MLNLEKYSEKLDQQRIEEKDKRTKLEEEIIDKNATHEAEVKLRLKFEAKLNTMHAVHRKLDAKYADSLTKIDSLLEDNELLKNERSQLLDSLGEVKTEKVELENRIQNDIEKIQMLANDILAKNKFIEDFTEKLQETIREKDNTQYKLSLSNKEVDKIKSGIKLLEGKDIL